jgi:hypothetical protein
VGMKVEYPRIEIYICERVEKMEKMGDIKKGAPS